ncbi:MAG: hypothetical protein ACXW4T_08120 [Candidatus Limnocylindrales bacterium]
MYDRVRALDVIERALDTYPYCPACAAPTRIVDAGAELVLRCAATIDPQGVIARIGARMLPHIRRHVIDLREGIAA